MVMAVEVAVVMVRSRIVMAGIVPRVLMAHEKPNQDHHNPGYQQ
jgi:hypothetical protein